MRTVDEIDRLTPDQLNRLAAKTQWELKKREFGDHYNTVDTVDYWIEKKKIWLSEYDPCHNGQQYGELQKKYKVCVLYQPRSKRWYGYFLPEEVDVEDPTDLAFVECFAPTPELAVVKAVVASKYGREIDEVVLNEI
jgi:hypothetical protein